MAFSLAAGTLKLLQVVVLFVFNLTALRELLGIIHLAGPCKLKDFFSFFSIPKFKRQ